MAKIAVIKTGGKQYKVKEGQVLKVEKLAGEIGEAVKFDTLLVGDSESGDLTLGRPSLGDKVSAKILDQGKSDKVSVIKFKSKVHYKKNVGHRQPFTKVEVSNIA